MKTSHLLDAIDAFSAKSSANDYLTSIELKALIQDIRDASDAVHNVQEFYDTLERVVLELRGMSEHAAAFLNRVRKSEAPNYYEIIKRPMDLGTVLKKVKSQQYKDKKSFADDLNLIWDNCFEYNTWPDHPLRKSATIMRNKTNQLLQFVTEIATKQNASAGRAGSAAIASDDDAEGDTDDEVDETDRVRKGRASQKRPPKGPKLEEDASDAIQQLTRTRENSMVAAGPNDSFMDVDSQYEATPELGRSRSPSVDIRRYRRRKSLAARTDLVPFEERPALLRTPKAMSDLITLDGAQDDEPIASTSSVTLESAPCLTQREKPMPLAVQQLSGRHSRAVSEVADPFQAESERPKEWWDLVNSDEFLRAGLPAIPFAKCQNLPLNHRKPGYVAGKPDGARQLMASNLSKLRCLKSLHLKWSATDVVLSQNGDPSSLDLEEGPNEALPTTFKDLGKSNVPLALYTSTVAADAAEIDLRTALATLSAHAGFDAASKNAFDVLVGVTVRYLSNLGAAFQTGLDQFPNRLSFSHLLQHVLAQNGVQHPADLTRYVEEDIRQLNGKLDKAIDASAAKRKQQLGKLEMLKAAQARALEEDLKALSPVASPEPFVPLEQESDAERLAAIEAQVGLLRPFLAARMKTERGLVDDSQSKDKGKPKPPADASGQIPVPGKRKAASTTATAKRPKLGTVIAIE